jgi:hypothetical protein
LVHQLRAAHAHRGGADRKSCLEDYSHYRRGEAAAVASGVENVIGRAPRAVADFARDCAAAFA